MEHLLADCNEVWAPSAMVPLIRFADRARSIASTGLDLVGLPDVESTRTTIELLTGFDSIVSWYGAGRPEFREAVAQLGLPFRFLQALPRDVRMHAADFFLQQAGGSGRAVPRIACARRDESFVAIHPFSGSARKNWPLERFEELARRIGMPVRWCAGLEERLANAARFDNLYELAQWLAGARLYIGNDSGITHLAAAAGTPVVAVFGPSDPVVWAPRGERVRIVARADGGWPEVEETLAAARELIA